MVDAIGLLPIRMFGCTGFAKCFLEIFGNGRMSLLHL